MRLDLRETLVPLVLREKPDLLVQRDQQVPPVQQVPLVQPVVRELRGQLVRRVPPAQRDPPERLVPRVQRVLQAQRVPLAPRARQDLQERRVQPDLLGRQARRDLLVM